MSTTSWLAFLAAAAIGATARYLVDGFVQDRTRGAFPFGTVVVNTTGCFLLGILVGLGLYHGLDPATRIVLGTGGLGAYTTFSTFTFESVRLFEEGATGEALQSVAAGLVLGAAAAAAGLALSAGL